MNDPAEQLAKMFHDYYESLAPQYGYKTRDESAKPWEQVPRQNRSLMTRTARAILADERTPELLHAWSKLAPSWPAEEHTP